MVLEIDEDKRRISLGMKQCKANPWEEFAATVQARRQGQGPGQVDHRLRRVRRPGRRHRRPGAPVRPVVERAGRSRGAQLQEGPGSRGDRAGRRRRARAHLAGHQAARQRPVHQLHLGQRPRRARHRQGQDGRRARRRDPAQRRRHRLPARFRDQPRPRRGRAQRAEGRRRGQRHDHQRRPQDAFDPAVDQGQGQRRPAGSDAAPVADATSARPPARPAWARCCAPSSTTSDE